MKDIIIYPSEAKLGLADSIRNNSSFAYCCKVEKSDPQNSFSQAVLNASEATEEKSDILYFTKSILVSTVWNKNDDVFLTEETWAARHTPIHKPTNLEHNRYEIVGHITNTWAIDLDGNVIDDNTPIFELSDFHLCNGAVIYRYFHKEADLTERAEKLIEEIEQGKKYVSMECLFPNFDYCLDDGGELRIISRNESTAFLTKHLRIFGGEGSYNGCKVGRVLRNIEFSGKGYVNTPANPDSIIFQQDSSLMMGSALKKNSYNIANLLASTANEEKNMSDTILKEQLDEAKKTIASLEEKNESLAEKVSVATAAEFKSQIEELKASLDSSNESKNALAEELKEKSALVDELNTKVEALSQENTEVKTKLEEVEAEQVKTNRVSVLISGGFTKEDAESRVEKFVYLSDEQFGEVSEALIQTLSKEDKEDEKDEKKGKKEKDAEANDSEILDEVEVVDASEDVGSTDATSNEREEKLSALASYFDATFGGDTEDKTGEK